VLIYVAALLLRPHRMRCDTAPMKSLIAIVVNVLCVCMGPLAAHAQPMLPLVGQRVSGPVSLFGKQVPLPPGEWRISAAGFAKVSVEDPGGYGAIGDVLLLPVDPRAPYAFALVRVNALPVRDGWGAPLECSDAEALFVSAAETRDLHNACSVVLVASSARIRALVGRLPAAASPPLPALLAGFRASDRRDVVEAWYGFRPPAVSVDQWSGPKEALDAAHRELIASIGAWIQQAREASFTAMRDPAAQATSIPSVVLTTSGAPEAKGEVITSLRLSLYKLATYRAPVTAFNWILASALAGDLYVGAVVAGWQSITHSALYFGNEMAWEWPRTPFSMPFTPTGGGLLQPPAASVAASASIYSQDGKQLPLPGGPWTVIADHGNAAAHGVVLAQLEGNALRGLAIVHTNPVKTANIFGTASDCSRTDGYFATIRYDTPLDGYCAYSKPVLPDDTASDALWADAKARLAATHVELPVMFQQVGVRARTRDNFIDVRYYFPANGIAAVPRGSATLRESTAALQAWADLLQPSLEAGLRGRLPASLAAVPWPHQIAEVSAELTRGAHAPLELLHAAGALDDAEYDRQLALADAALAEREQLRWSLWLRSAYKVATYRVLSYVDAVVVSGIITFSAAQSLIYATVNAAGQPIMAYANEIGWAGSGVGRPSASLQPVDFPEIGRDPS
jgi:uncharacterized membrane protein